MLEQTVKSSGLSAKYQKLLMDFFEETSLDGGMGNDDEIDPEKARTGLFAIVTSRLEDAHEIAVKGQSSRIDKQVVFQLTGNLECNLDEIELLLKAVALVSYFNAAES